MGINSKIAEKYSLAENFILEGKELFAVQIYKQLLDEGKEVRSTLLRLAHLYEKMKLYKEVVELIENYLKQNDDVELEVLYGQFLLRTKNFLKAAKIFDKIDKQKRPDAFYFCGIAYFENKNPERAFENFKNYINTGETNFLDKALFASVKIALELKLLDEAIELLQKLEKMPNIERSELFFLFGKTYFAKQLFFYANDAFEKAIKRGKKNFETFYLFGRTNLNIGEYDNAILAFENARNLAQGNAELLALTGFAYIGKGEIETAQKYLAKAMEHNPFDKNVIALKNKLLNLFEVQNRED